MRLLRQIPAIGPIRAALRYSAPHSDRGGHRGRLITRVKIASYRDPDRQCTYADHVVLKRAKDEAGGIPCAGQQVYAPRYRAEWFPTFNRAFLRESP